ncbi:hypothetical protein R69888_02867 [Paraburkholderia haematera]|uniref:Uncharacterized protein n=1 Tax=Paraburkholderia haematera TaxID=2793077 RepID=A0ABM8REP4_9BURK|nr:hypothetical protein R69888_02867 [Paraburkholderia haematera]
MQTKVRTIADLKYGRREYSRVFVAEVVFRSATVSCKLPQWPDEGVRVSFATCSANFPLSVGNKGGCGMDVSSDVLLAAHPASRLRASESSHLER